MVSSVSTVPPAGLGAAGATAPDWALSGTLGAATAVAPDAWSRTLGAATAGASDAASRMLGAATAVASHAFSCTLGAATVVASDAASGTLGAAGPASRRPSSPSRPLWARVRGGKSRRPGLSQVCAASLSGAGLQLNLEGVSQIH